jgi:hypothetical protein
MTQDHYVGRRLADRPTANALESALDIPEEEKIRIPSRGITPGPLSSRDWTRTSNLPGR